MSRLLDIFNEVQRSEPPADTPPITEARRAFKVRKGKIVKAFRCTIGRRKGILVSSPAVCFQKKNILRARQARLAARKVKFIRARHAKMTRRKAIHQKVLSLNR